jgi:hypothetical protein
VEKLGTAIQLSPKADKTKSDPESLPEVLISQSVKSEELLDEEVVLN